MHTWLATGPGDRFFQAMIEGRHPCWLGAFPIQDRFLAMIDPKEFRFFLDSGAYSAWSRGTVIDLDEYCAFIRHNIELIEVYASLDVIPGVPGQNATEKQRDEAAEQSWKNYLYMQREGLDPLPVYHYGENPRYLERMLEYGCPYIGIGGLVGIPGERRRVWLDRVFDRLTNDEGKPIVQTHGFGMTSIPLIFRYPWYSVDSTTWIKVTAMGGVYLPAVVNGEFVFDQVPEVVSVSSSNPRQRQGGKGANTMVPSTRAVLDKWLALCGQSYDDVCKDYYHRAVCNVAFFKRVSEAKAERPYQKGAVKRGSMW